MLSVIYYASCLYINDCTFLISQLILTSVGQRTVLWTVLLADVKGQSPLGLQYKQLGQITRTVTATSRCGWLPTVSGTQSSPSLFFCSSHILKCFRIKFASISSWQTTVQTKCLDDWAGTLSSINLQFYSSVTRASDWKLLTSLPGSTPIFPSCRYRRESRGVRACVPLPLSQTYRLAKARTSQESGNLSFRVKKVNGTSTTCKRDICKGIFTRSMNLKTLSLHPTLYQYCCAGKSQVWIQLCQQKRPFPIYFMSFGKVIYLC